MTEEQKPKRPAAHVWVIGLLSFMTAGFVITLVGVATGRSSGSLNFRQNWLPLAFLSAAAFALFCLIVGGRHRWAYYITSRILGIWTLRGIYNVLVYAWLLAFGKRPLNINYFHFSERGQPFYVQQLMFIANYLAMPATVALIVWVFVRFTFTRESRSYFQFKKSAGNDPGEPGKSTKQQDEAPTLS
jgi:hypothetical protein